MFKFCILIPLCFSLCAANTSAEPQALNQEPNQPAYLKSIPPNKLKEDLDFLFKTIEEVHPNMYAYTPKEQFDPLREQLYRDINHPMTRLEFYKLTAPVIAELKNGHTQLYPPLQEFKNYYENGGQVFPLKLSSDGSMIILSKDYSSEALPIGGQVLTINDRSASELFESFSRLFGVEGSHKSLFILNSGNPNVIRCLLFLEYGPIKSWKLNIRSDDRKSKSYTIKSVPSTEIERQETQTDLESNSYRHLPEYNISLLEIKSFGGWEGDFEKFNKFIVSSFQKVQEQQPSALIIDVRENQGGADNLVSQLLEYLTSKPFRLYEKTEIKISDQSESVIEHIRHQFPEKFENKKEGDIVIIELPFYTPSSKQNRYSGEVFVLIGPQTWSAATVFASTVKCFRIGMLVGEETPDTPTLYGSSIKSKLPNSELVFVIASKLMIAPCGKPDGRGVIPDYQVKQKPEDTAKGIDTALQFTLNLIKKTSVEEHKK